ncbi:hypothetical protein Tco_0508492 [Tanacetum coccineum]
MSTPMFAKTYNLVAFLEKPTEGEGFKQIVDFLNANMIKIALTVNPTIYTSCIEQFWTFVNKTVKEDVWIQALVDGKKKIFANMKREGKGFSGVITPLFDTMMVQAAEEKKHKSRRTQRKEIEVPQDESPNEESVLDLEEAKTAQAKEIASLKKRVKKLEKSRKSRFTTLKRLKKVALDKINSHTWTYFVGPFQNFIVTHLNIYVTRGNWQFWQVLRSAAVLVFLTAEEIEAKKEAFKTHSDNYKLKVRGSVCIMSSLIWNHSLSHRTTFSVKPEISKPDISKASSAGGKLHILKPSCERIVSLPSQSECLSHKSDSKKIMTLMCILIVPQQNTGFILDSDMEGKNEESYKFPIAVQQFSLIERSCAVFRFTGPPHHDFSLMDILPGKSTSYILDSWYSLGILASLGHQEDASKQGRMIDNIDQDEEIKLVDETQGRIDDQDMFGVNDLDGDEVIMDDTAGKSEEQSAKVAEIEVSTADPVTTAGKVIITVDVEVSAALTTTRTTDDELTLAQTLIEIKAAKPKAITTAATTVTAATTRPKAKGIIMQEPSEIPSLKPIVSSQKPSQPKEKGKAKMVEPERPLKRKEQIMMDEQMARDL